jgi:hypothetical protein
VDQLSRLKLLGLFAYVPKVDLPVCASGENVLSVESSTEAGYPAKVFVSCLVSTVNDPV